MTPPMDFKDLPHFKPKRPELLAAILFLLERAAELGLMLSKGEIVKSLFIADDQHLAEYGRPITFDNYVAMHKGPVGDLTISMLDDKVSWSSFRLDAAPWEKKQRRGHSYYVMNGYHANLDVLSASDVDHLEAALAHVAEKGYDQVSEETHLHPAWTTAWAARAGDAKAAPMDWRNFPTVRPDGLPDLVSASWGGN